MRRHCAGVCVCGWGLLARYKWHMCTCCAGMQQTGCHCSAYCTSCCRPVHASLPAMQHTVDVVLSAARPSPPLRYRAWSQGGEHPFLLDTLWDLLHVVDYITTRPEADATRIGITGKRLLFLHARHVLFPLNTLLAEALDKHGCPADMHHGFPAALDCHPWQARAWVGCTPGWLVSWTSASLWWPLSLGSRSVCLAPSQVWCVGLEAAPLLHKARLGMSGPTAVPHGACMACRSETHQQHWHYYGYVVQGFRWAVEHDAWHARVASIPQVM
jgi:hypothetical protein